MRGLMCGFAGMLLVGTTVLADTFEDAQKAFKDKQYKDAIKLLDEHIKANAGDAKAYLLRGQARASEKQFVEAMGDFDKTVELDPKAAPAYFFRAKLHLQDKKGDKALADYNKAIELAPKQPLFLIERGNLLLTGGAVEAKDKAFADFDQAVRLEPKSAAAYFGRGRAVLEKTPKVAILKKDDKTIAVIIGYRPDEAKRALPDIDKAIELAPKSAPPLVVRAMCYEALADPVKEVADRKAAAALDKANAQNLNRLVWLLAASYEPKARDGKAAVEIATQLAERTKNTDPIVLDTLAVAQAEAGDFKAAVANQEKAIELLKPPEKSPLRDRLELYKQEKPFRMPEPKKAEPKKD